MMDDQIEVTVTKTVRLTDEAVNAAIRAYIGAPDDADVTISDGVDRLYFMEAVVVWDIPDAARLDTTNGDAPGEGE